MLKKVVSFIFVFVLITGSFLGFSSSKIFAASAPPITEFYIMGYSWSDLYTGTYNYWDKSYADTVPVPDSTPYIVTYQMGYGAILSPYTMNTIDAFPITDSNNIVVGFVKVTSLANLPTGLNTINIACNSYNSPWNVMRDSITLNIQPPVTPLTSSLKSTNTINPKNLKNIKTINDLKDFQKSIN